MRKVTKRNVPMPLAAASKPLPAPTNVKLAAHLHAWVEVTWDAVPKALSYQVQYCEKGAKPPVWHNALLVKAPTVQATVTNLQVGITYDFRIFANGV